MGGSAAARGYGVALALRASADPGR
jgi:hypothetical protein